MKISIWKTILPHLTKKKSLQFSENNEINRSAQTRIKRIDWMLDLPWEDNPALNKIGPRCTSWIIFCTGVLLLTSGCPCPLKSAETLPGVFGKRLICSGVFLTWLLIHHSDCGRNSCTATDRTSRGWQVCLWPHRAPGTGKETFWPTFTHTQPAYLRPVCAR